MLAFTVVRACMGSLIFAVFGTITGGAVGHFWWRWGRKPIVETTDADTAAIFE